MANQSVLQRPPSGPQTRMPAKKTAPVPQNVVAGLLRSSADKIKKQAEKKIKEVAEPALEIVTKAKKSFDEGVKKEKERVAALPKDEETVPEKVVKATKGAAKFLAPGAYAAAKGFKEGGLEEAKKQYGESMKEYTKKTFAGVMPLKPDATPEEIEQYRQAQTDFMLNVGGVSGGMIGSIKKTVTGKGAQKVAKEAAEAMSTKTPDVPMPPPPPPPPSSSVPDQAVKPPTAAAKKTVIQRPPVATKTAPAMTPAPKQATIEMTPAPVQAAADLPTPAPKLPTETVVKPEGDIEDILVRAAKNTKEFRKEGAPADLAGGGVLMKKEGLRTTKKEVDGVIEAKSTPTTQYTLARSQDEVNALSAKGYKNMGGVDTFAAEAGYDDGGRFLDDVLSGNTPRQKEIAMTKELAAQEKAMKNAPLTLEDEVAYKYKGLDIDKIVEEHATPWSTREEVLQQLERDGVLASRAKAANLTPGQPPVEPPKIMTPKDMPQQERGFVSTVKESDITDPVVRKGIEGSYTPIANKPIIDKANAWIDEVGRDAALSWVTEAGAPMHASRMITGQLLMKRFQEAGAVAKMQGKTLEATAMYDRAIGLAEHIAENATEMGQAIQALSIWGRLTPDGALRMAQKLVNKYNNDLKLGRKISITPKQADDITRIAKELEALPEPKIPDTFTPGAYNKEVRDYLEKAAELMDAAKGVVPSSFGDKVVAYRNLSLLLNPKTLLRNVIGNSIFMTAENLSAVLGTPIDMAVSLLTGTRTRTLPSLGAQVKGGAAGVQIGFREALKGIDTTMGAISKDMATARVLRGTILEPFEKTLSAAMKAPDRAFYEAAFAEEMTNLVAIKKMGKLGDMGKGKISSLLASDVTDEMVKQAHMTAMYRTFQDKNWGSKMLQGLRNFLNLGQKHGLGDFVVPFVQTPGSLLAKGLVDYSPAGYAKALWEIAKTPMGAGDQRKFVDALSRATVGTTGAVGVGYLLANAGIIQGKENKDFKESAVRRLAGYKDYSFNWSAARRFFMSGGNSDESKWQPGDVTYTLDWAQPISMPFFMGANLAETGSTEGIIGTIAKGAEVAANTFTDQPFVAGVKRTFFNNNPIKGISDVIQGVPPQFVPTLSNQIRQAVDNTKYSTYDPDWWEEAKNKIILRVPWMADQLEKDYDLLGREQQNFPDAQSFFQRLYSAMMSPSMVNIVKEEPELNEAIRLFEETGEASVLPKKIDETQQMFGQSMPLTAQEKTEMAIYVGSRTQKALAAAEKLKLTDEQKAELVSKIINKSFKQARIKPYLRTIGVSDIPDELSEAKLVEKVEQLRNSEGVKDLPDEKKTELVRQVMQKVMEKLNSKLKK